MAFARRAAILAVIANPKVRATRDQRKLAAAQLLQAASFLIRSFPMLSVFHGGATQEQ